MFFISKMETESLCSDRLKKFFLNLMGVGFFLS